MSSTGKRPEHDASATGQVRDADGPEQAGALSLGSTVIASAIAACFGKTATHPLDTLKARIQVENSNLQSGKSSSTSATRTRNYLSSSVVRRELAGLSSYRQLWAGFPVAIIGSLPAGALYLTSYELVRRDAFFKSLFRGQSSSFSSSSTTSTSSSTSTSNENNAHPHEKSFVVDFCAGFIAETVSCLLWCPLDVMKERLQVQDKLGLYRYQGTWDAATQIIRNEGIRGLYRAYGATLAAFGPQTAINLALYEQLENRALVHLSRTSTENENKSEENHSPHKPPWLTFGCACASGCVAAFVTTPLDVARLRMQVVRRKGTTAASSTTNSTSASQPRLWNYNHFVDAIGTMAQEEGPRSLFKGAGVRCALWVPQTAIFLATFKYLLPRLGE
ncbi:unnamed protein product [Amoebophrya sp. A25]|nr:unnamed protein product [Amoebophrya sp. A25]|eukprot:GSA25T00000760001.1